VQTQHYLDGVGRCKACGELFPCPSVDRLLRELQRKVQQSRPAVYLDEGLLERAGRDPPR